MTLAVRPQRRSDMCTNPGDLNGGRLVMEGENLQQRPFSM